MAIGNQGADQVSLAPACLSRSDRFAEERDEACLVVADVIGAADNGDADWSRTSGSRSSRLSSYGSCSGHPHVASGSCVLAIHRFQRIPHRGSAGGTASRAVKTLSSIGACRMSRR